MEQRIYDQYNQAQLKEIITLCEAEKDFETRNILMTLLKDTEEDHIKWIEIQLELLKKIGEQIYFQSQM